MRTIAQNFKYVDYFDKYERIMQFNKNKQKYLHGWYPFVEGYSKEFINSIIEELDYVPEHCLEPFSGSGTTAVELQKHQIKCTSFEINPFMHSLAKSKLRTDYKINSFRKYLRHIEEALENVVPEIEKISSIPLYKSLIERENSKKWIFNKETMRGLLDIKNAIEQINDSKYRNLFKIGLASLLLELSNVYRNGKALSYKKEWKELQDVSRQEVHYLFIERIKQSILGDIVKINNLKTKEGALFSNHKHCYLGDCKEKISILEDDSIDLIITSPPYLNSRDYTDSYMIELWMLDLIKDYEELRELRKTTFKSHVQASWGEMPLINIRELVVAVEKIEEYKELFWNKNLLNMIKGYFVDMDLLFSQLSPKVKNGGKVYFNVANSAYYGVEIEVDKIISKIAEMYGFKIEEIRKARKIRPSSQQKEQIPYLLEVVIVMEKTNAIVV